MFAGKHGDGSRVSKVFIDDYRSTKMLRFSRAWPQLPIADQWFAMGDFRAHVIPAEVYAFWFRLVYLTS